jgi:hypothetical protein
MSQSFDCLLPQSERESVLYHLIPQDTEEDQLSSLLSDPFHHGITATARISAKYCREILRLPTHTSESSTASLTFQGQLRDAFTLDYRMPNIIRLGGRAIQWCKKLRFTSAYDPSTTAIIPLLYLLTTSSPRFTHRRLTLIVNKLVRLAKGVGRYLPQESGLL